MGCTNSSNKYEQIEFKHEWNIFIMGEPKSNILTPLILIIFYILVNSKRLKKFKNFLKYFYIVKLVNPHY
jgi:hypothetical protein